MSALRLFPLALLCALALPVAAQAAEPVASDSPSDARVAPQPVPEVCAPAVDCCPQPSIRYVAHRRCRRTCCCRGRPPVETVLRVQDPRCCSRVVEVPLCLPGCCEGAPCVTSRRGLLCRGVSTYTWCRGFKVRVVFRHGGEIVVHTYGS